MRKVLLIGVLLFLAGAGSNAYALDYTWIGVGTTAQWAAAANWDNGTGGSLDWPDDPTDRAIVAGTGSVRLYYDGSGFAITVGELVINNTAGLYRGREPLGYTITTSKAGGLSGDFWWRSTTTYDAYFTDNPQGSWTWDIAGNFYYAPTSVAGGPTAPGKIIMRGNNAAFKWNSTTSSVAATATRSVNFDIYGQGVWDNGSNSVTASTRGDTLTVKTGGSIGSNASVSGRWAFKYLVLEGPDRQAQLPTLNAPVDFRYGCSMYDNNSMRLVVTSGVTYPRDVEMGTGYWTGTPKNPEYIWRMKGGDLGVGRDLKVQSYTGNSPGRVWLDTLENGTTTARNLTVNRDLLVGASSSEELYGVKLNSSTVRVGRDIIVGSSDTANSGTLDLGSATIRLGGNLTVRGPLNATSGNWTLASWNAGTSTLICDGNGTTSTTFVQTLRTQGDDGVKLHNLVIDTNAIVQLYTSGTSTDGNLLLSGDLEILNGTFRQNNRPITFNGTHLLKNLATVYGTVGTTQTAGVFDNIVLAPDAVLLLGSDITISSTDNLVMGLDSKLYLCGFTLVADGLTYVDGAQPQWVNDAGLIMSGSGVIPEPGTMLLLGTGLIGILGCARRRRMR